MKNRTCQHRVNVRLFIRILFLCWVFQVVPFQAPAAVGDAFARKTDALFQKIGEAFKAKLPVVVQAIDNTQTFDLSVGNVFYDPHLQRVFFEFKGQADLPRHFPVAADPLFITSDGAIAYDILYEKPVLYRSAKRIIFHGDAVISLDKILYEFAKETTLIGGALALDQAGDFLVEFFRHVDSKFIAEVLSKSVTRFSREAVAVSGAEIMLNASKLKNPKLAEVIRSNLRDGDLLTYTALIVLKSGSVSLASVSGGTLGAMVGNVLVPGVGGAVGAYLGSKITATIAKTVIHKATVDIPISILLGKIAKFSGRVRSNPRDGGSADRLKKYQEFIVGKVRKEVDYEEYATLDRLLEKIDRFPAAERQAFVGLLKDIQEVLRFKLMEERDWYASKKLLQMKERIKAWGLESHFAY